VEVVEGEDFLKDSMETQVEMTENSKEEMANVSSGERL